MSLTTDKQERRRQGGRLRAERLSPERRRAIARAGGLAKAAAAKKVVIDDETVEQALTALTLLKSVRSQFRGWGCGHAADRIEHAISSAKAAVRTMRSKAGKAH